MIKIQINTILCQKIYYTGILSITIYREIIHNKKYLLTYIVIYFTFY